MNRRPEIEIKSKSKIKRGAFGGRLNLNHNRNLPFSLIHVPKVGFGLSWMRSMSLTKVLAGAAMVFATSQLDILAQSPYLYHLTLQGTCYQTNGTGNFVATPLTDKVLVQDAAQAGGVSPSSIALVYHLQSSGLGDTIDIVDTNGSTKINLFGLYFGDDPTLGRSASTNATQTEIRRLDYIYTQQNTTFTSFNSHSMGSAFTVKRFLTDTNGTTRATIEAQMSWIVNPQGTNGTKLCIVNFATATPYP